MQLNNIVSRSLLKNTIYLYVFDLHEFDFGAIFVESVNDVLKL